MVVSFTSNFVRPALQIFRSIGYPSIEKTSDPTIPPSPPSITFQRILYSTSSGINLKLRKIISIFVIFCFRVKTRLTKRSVSLARIKAFKSKFIRILNDYVLIVPLLIATRTEYFLFFPFLLLLASPVRTRLLWKLFHPFHPSEMKLFQLFVLCRISNQVFIRKLGWMLSLSAIDPKYRRTDEQKKPKKKIKSHTKSCHVFFVTFLPILFSRLRHCYLFI